MGELGCTVLKVNKLWFLACLIEKCGKNFLGGGKNASFRFRGSLRQSSRNSKGSEKKSEIPEGRRD